MNFNRYASAILRRSFQRDPKRMLIGLDARTLFASQRRGIARSLLMMYHELAKIRPNWHVIAYHRDNKNTCDLPENWFESRFIEMPGDRFDAWTKMRLPLAAVQDRVDVLHCPANMCPKWMPVPTVVTIHDLIPIDMPHGQEPGFIKRFNQSVKHACQRADAITCPSEYTKKRLVKKYHADLAHITTNHWGVTTQTANSHPAPKQIREKYGINKQKYVLHFGAGEIRKNTRRLIESWSMLPFEIQQVWQLVIVGLDFQTLCELKQYQSSLNLADSVLLYDFADEQDLPALMHGAEVLAYPSLSEGFGLPILEAFDAKTAVLTSNCTCLPEIAGDAATFVDPTHTEQISQALRTLLSNDKLRAQLIKAGSQRVKTFTWQRCAEQFAQTLEQITHQPARRQAA